MNHALVLACGNSLRGDDGLAVAIARFLHAGFCDPRTEILASQQWTPELAEPISRADLVIFLDASVSLSPGSIRLQSIAPAVARTGSLTHSFTPDELLGLAKQLYERVPESAYLLTVGGESFEQSERLSHSVLRAIPAVLTQIKALLSGVSLPLAEFQSPSV
jgi:hydrogenase maturation protease